MKLKVRGYRMQNRCKQREPNFEVDSIIYLHIILTEMALNLLYQYQKTLAVILFFW